MIDSYIDLERERLKVLLEHFTYKPKWRFSLVREGLLISIIAPNTDNPEQMIEVNLSRGIPSFVHPDFPWEHWLLDQIMEIERHEAQEFFKIDGIKVFDPHG